MKNQIKIPGFIYAGIPDSWEFGDAHVVEGVSYRFSSYDSPSAGKTKITAYDLVFDAPKNEDVTEGFVSVLEGKKKKLMADCQKETTAIDRQIQQLLAITNEVSA